MSTKISFAATDANDNNFNKTLPDVNPNASNADLKTFVQGLNALTDNTITGIRRVEVTDILNGEDDTDTRLDRNLTLYRDHYINPDYIVTSIASSTISTTPDEPTEYLLHGQGITENSVVYLQNRNFADSDIWIYKNFYFEDNCFVVNLVRENNTGTDELTFYMPGDENYKPATITIPITA